MLHLRIGASVRAADGTYLGKAGRVVIDPRTEELTHLVVQDELDSPSGVIVPIDLVATADDAEVRLTLDADAFGRLPEGPTIAYVPLDSIERGPLVGWQGPPDYAEREILVPAEVLYDVPVRPFAPQIVQEGGLLSDAVPDVAEETEVTCQGEVVGHVAEVLTDERTRDLRGITVRLTEPGEPIRVVPASMIARITPAAVELACTREELADLPAH